MKRNKIKSIKAINAGISVQQKRDKGHLIWSALGKIYVHQILQGKMPLKLRLFYLSCVID
ncbi:hypothetical protein [Sphingobacterium sp. B29]|uniref:hypothetical protein n=1 Tax=Sphingobacterium sp. B29 TaxID=1933220 RepID=UPI001F1A0143|nr:MULTISPECIES: hypothetical protein [Sphingobacterium]